MIATYRYGDPRTDDALRIGVARQPPRGVRREDFPLYFDLWLRILAPSTELLRAYRARRIDFPAFERRYRAEMAQHEPRQVIDLVATLSQHRAIRVGCFCDDESRCHRSVLKTLLTAAAANLPTSQPRRRYASPACFANEDEF